MKAVCLREANFECRDIQLRLIPSANAGQKFREGADVELALIRRDPVEH